VLSTWLRFRCPPIVGPTNTWLVLIRLKTLAAMAGLVRSVYTDG
jgi:hypothetical protein